MKILALVDTYGWCWSKTATALAANMPDHDVQVCTYEELAGSKCDLLYIRGLNGRSNSTQKIRHSCPHCPIVVTFTTGGFRMVHAWERTGEVLQMADAVVCQNEEAAAFLKEKGCRRVTVIHPGVDIDAYSPKQYTTRPGVVGMAANIKDFRWKSKGIEPTIEACANLGLKFECATARTARANGGEWCVGYIEPDKMPAWYNSLWCYCMPSIVEGCSNSINEAMATGLPCIICPAGHHADSCRDAREYEDGEVLLVEQTTQSVQEALQWLIDNPAGARRIGRNARKWAIKHSSAASAANHQRLFESVYKAASPVIITSCTASYAECLRVTLNSWLANAGVGRILVATDDAEALRQSLGDIMADIEFVQNMPSGLDWVGCMQARTHAIADMLTSIEPGTKIAHIDADCLIMRPLYHAWSTDFDIAATRWTGRKETNIHNGCAQAGVWFGRAGKGLSEFFDYWIALQTQYAKRPWMANQGKICFDQYAFTDALALWYGGYTVAGLPETKWNLYGPPGDLPGMVAAINPSIVHLKGGQWRNQELVDAILNASEKAQATRGEGGTLRGGRGEQPSKHRSSVKRTTRQSPRERMRMKRMERKRKG